MELGMIGLGKMGGNMTARLLDDGHRVVVYNQSRPPIEEAAAAGAEPAASAADVVTRLEPPRHVWSMVPAGEPTESVVTEVAGAMAPGDAVLDGGNSNYKDTLRRADVLAEDGLHLVDVGTSGGIWGRTEGYSMMVGGDAAVVDRLRPVFETLAPGADRGWGHVGPTGSGHFVKMVHNGIEYGLMEAYAEGFAIMRAKEQFDLDLHQVAEIWRFGSVVRSWLLDLTARALDGDQALEDVAPWVADSGEGRWTVFEAVDLDISAPVISLALMRRLQSRDDYGYSDRLLAALRNQFGGHAVRDADAMEDQ